VLMIREPGGKRVALPRRSTRASLCLAPKVIDDPPLLMLNSPLFTFVTGPSFLIDGALFGAGYTGQPTG
jgi:hypothetical protein